MGVFDGHLTTDSINLKPINYEISKLKIKTSVIEEVLTKIPFNAQGEITKDLDLKDFKIVNVKQGTQNKSAVNYLQMKHFTTNMQFEVNMNNNKITNLQNPVSNQDAVTKQYVDNHPSNILNYIKKDPATGAYRGTVLLDSDNKLACNLSNNFTTDTYGVIHIDPKSLVKLNAELNQNGSVIVDENNKLKVNLNDNFLIDSNGKINLKITNGLTYDNYYLTLNLNPIHLKLDPDGKLNLDTTNLTYTAGTGINLANRVISAEANSRRGINVDQNGIGLKTDFTTLLDIDNDSLKINAGKLVIDMANVTSHLIKLIYNSAITRDFNRFYDVK